MVMCMQHLTTISIVSDIPEGKGVAPAQMSTIGPYLQGVLMERLDTSYVEWLHRQPFNPYSQYCYADKGSHELIWRIHALTDEAAEQVIRPMQDVRSIKVRGIGSTLEVRRSTVEVIELTCLTDLIRDGDTGRSSLSFLTPTSFKSASSYVFMPSVRLILQNLLMRYNQLYEGDKEVGEETMLYMERCARIVSYKLHSQYFPHVTKDHKIPAFVGSVVLKCHGPQPMIGLVRMLLKFGEYAGIGIKTSMGMGGVRCT